MTISSLRRKTNNDRNWPQRPKTITYAKQKWQTKGEESMANDNMYRTKLRERWMWCGVVGMMLIILAFISTGIALMFPDLSLIWAAIIGATLEAIALFFMKGIELFVIRVAAYHGAVGFNSWESYERPENDVDRLVLSKDASLEEVGPGVHPTWPWQKWTFIDIRKQVTTKKTLIAYTSDNVKLEIDRMMVFSPLRGFLCNLVRNTDEEAQDILEAKVDSAIITKINSLKDSEVFAAIPDIADCVANILGGDKKSSEDEQQLGLSATDLTATEIRRDAEYQKVAMALIKAQNNAAAVKALVAAGNTNGGGITETEAGYMVLAQEDKVDIKIIRGLEGLRYAPMMNIPGLDGDKRDRRDNKNNKDKGGKQDGNK